MIVEIGKYIDLGEKAERVCYPLEGRTICKGTRIVAGLLPRVISAFPEIKIKSRIFRIKEDILPVFLRPYQKEAIEAWMRNRKMGVIILPTGAGKTILALYALYKLRVTTLILVPQRPLLKQWQDRIREFLGIDAGIYGGGYKQIRPITITTYKSAPAIIKKYGKFFTFLVADEVHHVPANTLIDALMYCQSIYRMGLTATLERSDEREPIATQLIGPVVYERTFADLKEYFPDISYKLIRLRLSPVEKHKYESFETTDERMKYLGMNRKKIGAIVELVRKCDGKVLIFNRYVDVAKAVAYYIHQYTDKAVALLYGQTPRKEREKILQLFAEGYLDVIVTTTVLDEGLDVSDVKYVILNGAGKSGRQLVQRIGRGMRKGKKRLIVYDVIFVGTKEEDFFAKRKRKLLRIFNK